ncbi:hypothetical protein HYPSUDRAFT_612848 [Hypholoma sublateritium FD-334 SS-4]|uniref:Homeobox domain-containing protein n=1 Tax=Hypholoma sublateritium (strain FD-334 SS-4) TaxID=945553 RepID=A0A0D2MHA2_HYPSF|nr:hypothetical protein HYPSUDRAFT_612848 [Hypholoma sublateritium FD-334 SS-4]
MDMAQHDMFTPYSRASLGVDSMGSQTDDESSNPSPAADSPRNPFPKNTGIDGKLQDRNASPSGLPDAAAKPEKEKRKRSRVTPEQLVHLERFFVIDRSPTAARRRDISELLGMQERQTQIWFQNRRAKAKLQDSKSGTRDAEASPDSSTSLPPARHDTTVQKLIHEDEPVSIIPCTDLTVGNWRRISSPGDVHDLVAYVCDTKRCLNWFIHSGGYGFKMEIPFHTVTNTEYKMIGPHTGIASFVLSQPPVFYLENVGSPLSDDPPVRTWKRCSDWTEGHQASKVLRHTVLGSDAELVFLLRNLPANSGTSSIPLRANAYRADCVSTSPMELQPPPLAGLGGANTPYADSEMKSRPGSADVRKRSPYSLPDERYAAAHGDLHPPPHSAPPGPFSRNGFMRPIHPSTTPNFDSGVYSNYPGVHQAPEPPSYSPVPPGGGLYNRPYAAQPQPYFDESPRGMQPFQQDVDDMSPRISQPRDYSNPSPTGFPQKYHPEMHRDRQQLPPPHQGALSGLPGMMYTQANNNMYSC